MSDAIKIEVPCRWGELLPEDQLGIVRLVNAMASGARPLAELAGPEVFRIPAPDRFDVVPEPYIRAVLFDNRTVTLELWADWWDLSWPDAETVVDYINHEHNGRTVPVSEMVTYAEELWGLLDPSGVYVHRSLPEGEGDE